MTAKRKHTILSIINNNLQLQKGEWVTMGEHNNQIRTARDAARNCRGLSQYSFLQLTSELLRDTIRREQGVLDSMKQELALCEAGQLRIRKKGEKCYFGYKERGSERESSISGEPERIQNLARRGILTSSIKALEHRLKMLERVAGNSEEAYYDFQMKKRLERFANAEIDLSHLLFTKEQNEWIDEPYTPNPYNRDSLTMQTSSGIWVRSKSEAIIGTSLEVIGLPYRSDDLVRIITDGNKGAPFKDTYFADFKTPNFLGGITVHEHLGAFQIDHYADNALQRLNDYHGFTVIEIKGRPVASNEFTWSFESDISDAESIKRLIRKLLLPL